MQRTPEEIVRLLRQYKIDDHLSISRNRANYLIDKYEKAHPLDKDVDIKNCPFINGHRKDIENGESKGQLLDKIDKLEKEKTELITALGEYAQNIFSQGLEVNRLKEIEKKYNEIWRIQNESKV